MNTLFLGTDHAGFTQKEALKTHLIQKGWPVEDLGAHMLDTLDDYPDVAKDVALAVQSHAASKGILLCGSGQGVCIVANKFLGIRAAIGFSPEAAAQSRRDDDANVLCLGARLFSPQDLIAIVDTWLATPFSNEERHMRRIQKISRIEERS